MALALGLFAGSLLLCLGAAELLIRGLTRLGIKAGLQEGLIGLLAALGADAPELSSAVTAILSGAREVGVGVVVGSNLFNLAALLGVSSLFSKGVRIRRDPLLLDAAVGMTILLLAAALLWTPVPPAVVGFPAFAIFAAYALLLGHFHGVGRRYWPEAFEVAADVGPEARQSLSWRPALLLPAAVAGVLLGSVGMVHSALELAAAWHLSPWLLGSVVLAGLTSLPNLYVAIHFARADRGTALVSAAMNSNTINLVGGLFAPALLLGLGAAGSAAPAMAWLLLLTSLAVGLAAWRREISGWTGSLLVMVYLVFVAVAVASRP